MGRDFAAEIRPLFRYTPASRRIKSAHWCSWAYRMLCLSNRVFQKTFRPMWKGMNGFQAGPPTPQGTCWY